MKKILLTLLLACSSLSADWKDIWASAIENCHNKDFLQAERLFTTAIEDMERVNDVDHPVVYIDRARLYLILEKYDLALADAEKGLKSQKLSDKDKIRGLSARMSAKVNLDMPEGIIADAQAIADINGFTMEQTDSKIIMRNAPDCECFIYMMKNYFINSKMCDSEKDIHISNGNWIVKKSEKCPCNQKKKINKSVEGCEYWCEANALAAYAWCDRMFKYPTCKLACAATVLAISKACCYCCRQGEIYKTCVEPFGRILDYIKEPCDPLWD